MLEHTLHLGKLLLLLGVANGTPIIARKLLGSQFSHPLDGGARWPLDGRRVLGNSKTIRGVLVSLVATSAVAPVLGLEALQGAALAGLSMLGDSFSSFLKRRLDRPLHSQTFGLDQIPESLLPLLLLYQPLGLDGPDIVLIVSVFVVLELLLSRILYRLNIRDRPY